jgi:hypothetical protein
MKTMQPVGTQRKFWSPGGEVQVQVVEGSHSNQPLLEIGGQVDMDTLRNILAWAESPGYKVGFEP